MTFVQLRLMVITTWSPPLAHWWVYHEALHCADLSRHCTSSDDSLYLAAGQMYHLPDSDRYIEFHSVLAQSTTPILFLQDANSWVQCKTTKLVQDYCIRTCDCRRAEYGIVRCYVHIDGSLSHPALILNVNGSPFTVGCDSKGKIQVDAPDGPLKVLPRKSTDSAVAYFIKYYLLMDAGSFTSNPVYILC